MTWLLAATATGTTDPSTVPAPDPTVAPMAIAGFALVLLAVVCMIAGAINWLPRLDPVDLPTPDTNGEPPPVPFPGEPEVPQ